MRLCTCVVIVFLYLFGCFVLCKSTLNYGYLTPEVKYVRMTELKGNVILVSFFQTLANKYVSNYSSLCYTSGAGSKGTLSTSISKLRGLQNVSGSTSGSIPAIPQRFASSAAAGEFVDFNKLLYAIEVN